MIIAEDLAKELEKFHLTMDENVVVGDDLQEGEDVNTNKKVELMMIGKIFTSKPFNFEAMKRTLRSIWRLKEGVAVRMVETNLFVFQFSSLGDKEFVINEMPWYFDNQLLLLRKVRGDEQLPEVDESDPLGLDNFLRIKVMIIVRKPQRRGMKIATNRDCEETMIEEEKKEMRKIDEGKVKKQEVGDGAEDNEIIITKLGPPSHARRALFKKGDEVQGENEKDGGGVYNNDGETQTQTEATKMRDARSWEGKEGGAVTNEGEGVWDSRQIMAKKRGVERISVQSSSLLHYVNSS
ncbi:Glucoamylase intracellular sporulation-specific [Bienertia sinuspersici]